MSDSIHKSGNKVGLKCKVLARFEDDREYHINSKLAMSLVESH